MKRTHYLKQNFVCDVCNRRLYSKAVVEFKLNKWFWSDKCYVYSKCKFQISYMKNLPQQSEKVSHSSSSCLWQVETFLCATRVKEP